MREELARLIMLGTRGKLVVVGNIIRSIDRRNSILDVEHLSNGLVTRPRILNLFGATGLDINLVELQGLDRVSVSSRITLDLDSEGRTGRDMFTNGGLGEINTETTTINITIQILEFFFFNGIGVRGGLDLEDLGHQSTIGTSSVVNPNTIRMVLVSIIIYFVYSIFKLPEFELSRELKLLVFGQINAVIKSMLEK
jgi:hypothetical protein